ncbi:MAG: Bax inhibitor-1/YccA family protein [Armatimonadaceae bacterium]
MRTSNPTLNEETFDKFAESGHFNDATDVMTVEGTATKTGILLLLAVLSASFTWSQVLDPEKAGSAMLWAVGGAIGGFIVALVTIFKPKSAPITAPIYALLEGLFLGAISAIVQAQVAEENPGIVLQAVGLTFGVMAAMLVAYRTGLIKVTNQFVTGVVAATAGIALFYLVLFGLRLFLPGSAMGYFMWEPSLLSIGVSLFVVAIAALNLVLDFAMIQDGEERGAPKFMEWYGAFSLMVTLVWLYLEILRLLSKLSRR